MVFHKGAEMAVAALGGAEKTQGGFSSSSWLSFSHRWQKPAMGPTGEGIRATALGLAGNWGLLVHCPATVQDWSSARGELTPSCRWVKTKNGLQIFSEL